MRILWMKTGSVVRLVGVDMGTVPALRLVAHHAPRARMEATLDDGSYPQPIPLGELDFGHESIANLNHR